MKAAALAAGGVVRRALTPAAEHGTVRGLMLDLTRSRRELLAENALLRHQLLVAARQAKRPKLRVADRFVLIGVAAMFTNWRTALVLFQPETLLRWHRDLFQRLWAGRTKPKTPPKPRLAAQVIALLTRMAMENRTWGAKRIRGELLKLGIEVAKSTIQRHISRFRSTPKGQRWSTFLRNQAAGLWCCDLFEVRDLWFRCHFFFVVMHLESRKVLRAVTTREPTSAWLAQQLKLYRQHFAFVALGFATGLRPSTLRPLRRDGVTPDVLWDQGVLLIRRSHTRKQEVMEKPKTGLRQRLTLPDELMEVLRWHIQRLPDGPMQKSELLFPSETGEFRACSASTSRSKRSSGR